MPGTIPSGGPSARYNVVPPGPCNNTGGNPALAQVATPMELYSAADTLLTAFVPFEDWGGAVALLRAMPSQRTWALGSFAEALGRWLRRERDLFDAQRSFVKVEGGGKRGLAESLALLADGGAATGHSAADDEPLL